MSCQTVADEQSSPFSTPPSNGLCRGPAPGDLYRAYNIYSYIMSSMILIQYANKILKYIFYIRDLHCEGFYKRPQRNFIEVLEEFL